MYKYKYRSIILSLMALIMCLTCLMIQPTFAQEETFEILILNSYHSTFTWTHDQIDGITDEFKKSGLNIHTHVEHMDWKNFPNKENLDNLYTSYKSKYKNKQLDIVMTTDDSALEFALRHRNDIFPNVPIVFSGVNEEGLSLLVQGIKDITGVIETIDLQETIDMALQINPDIDEFYIVYDQTESGQSTYKLVADIIESLDRDIRLIKGTNKSHKDILEEVKRLKANSGVLITTYYMDAEGKVVEFEEFCKKASEISQVPVFHMYDMTMGYGNIGGSMISGKIHGAKAGELVVRILNGEKADSIDFITEVPMRKVFDYAQLKKFNIPMNRIHPDIEVINKPFSFIKTYKNLVITVILIVIILIVFIVALLLYNNEVRTMRNKLQQSYEELTQTYEELAASDEELQEQVEELNKIQDQLRKMAYYDPLTQLPNKRALYENFNSYILKCSNNKGAVVFIDADNFKLVNDTLGHTLGDQFIIKMSQRLQEIIKDVAKVYRMGGDEFILLISCIEDVQDVKNILEHVMLGFEKKFHINNMVIHNTVSAGVALYPEHGLSAEELIMRADIAMYKAKEQGKARYIFYDDVMNEDLLKRVAIEKNLRTAISNEEISLYYQPQYHFKKEEIVGFEALARWNNKELGWVSPLDFIKVAEDSGIIIPMGRWILEAACKFIKQMHNQGYTYVVAVNISLIQIMQDDFVDMVLEVLKNNDLEAKYLELEMTETMLIENFNIIVDKIETLRNHGVNIALDDFGTGYSSLSYLNRIPIDTLKIDKSFVDTISSDDDQRVIINILINLGHRMGLRVIAEGVETKEEFAYLSKYDCDSMQGYLFSKPLSEEEVMELLVKIKQQQLNFL